MKKINKNNKENYLNEDGTFLSEDWFDRCYPFYNGYARVKKDDKWNFLKLDGTFVSEEWFDDCFNFKNGYALVKNNNDYYNVINFKGKSICNFDTSYYVYEFLYNPPFYVLTNLSHKILLLNKFVKINLI